MSLLGPLWALLAAVGLLVLVLHLRSRRSIDVPSIAIWRILAEGSVSLRRVRSPLTVTVPLVLQLLAVLLLALAVAQPLLGTGGAVHRILLLDASGSMRATDVAPDRFAEATDRAAGLLAALPDDGRYRGSLIVVDGDPHVVLARRPAARETDSRLAGLTAGDGPADWTAAAALVPGLRLPGETTEIVVLTDDAAVVDRLRAGLPADVPVSAVVVGDAFADAALEVGLAATDQDAGRWRATGNVVFSRWEDGPVRVAVSYRRDGTPDDLEWASLDVEPPAPPAAGDTFRTPFTLDLELPAPGTLAFRLTAPDGGPADVAPHDDAAWFEAGGPAPVRVLYLGPGNPDLVRGLRAQGGVELFEAASLPADDASFDLVVVDGVAIERRPLTNTLWLADARLAGEPAPPVVTEPLPTGWDAAHALSRGVAWGAVVPPRGYVFPRLPGAELILDAAFGPLLQARTTSTGRELRLAFDTAGSAWTREPGFPIFLANLASWLTPGGRGACAVGEACALPAQAAGAAIAGPDGAPIRPATAAPRQPLPMGAAEAFVPRRAGLYRVELPGRAFTIVVANAAEPEPLPPAGDADDPATPFEARTWLLLAVVALLLAEGWIAGRGAERFLTRTGLANSNPLAGRRRFLLGLRVATLAALVVAIADAPLPLPGGSTAAVAVLGPDAERAVLPDGTATVALDGASRVVADAGDRPPDATPGIPDGADLGGAVRLAAAMLPDRGGRILLAGPAGPTRGNAAMTAAELAARQVPVDVLPAASRAGDTLVETVAAPPVAYEGDAFQLDAIVSAPAAGAATLSIRRDGEPLLERVVDLAAGRNRLQLAVPDALVGSHLYEVDVAAAGDDPLPLNNRNGTFVETRGQPNVLIVTPQADWGSLFAEALTVQGIAARVVAPKQAPFYLDGWLAFDLVVLMNVPAIELDTRQQTLIESFVVSHGGGLLILGGENTFGPGGYYQTAIERLSPLSSRVPRQAPRAAMMFVLDRSGSMQQRVGEVRRIDVAKAATVSAVELLHEESQVGVVVFDSEAHLIFPLSNRGDGSALSEALRPIEPGGGTAIYPGLVEAVAQFGDVDAPARHMVVMTDGLSEPGDFATVIAEAREKGITVSTVAIGEGADVPRLEEIARLGGGAFHATQDFAALPSILSQEAMLLSGSPLVEGPTQAAWTDRDADFLEGAPVAFPAVAGFVRTSAKPEAAIHAEATDPDGEAYPLLASWRIGSGRVLALATHGAGSWTEAWLRDPDYPRFWAQAIRHFLPSEASPGLHLDLNRAGDVVSVEVDAVTADGGTLDALVLAAEIVGPGEPSSDRPGIPLELRARGDGSYTGRFVLDAAGDYRVRVSVVEDRGPAAPPGSPPRAAAAVPVEARLHVAFPAWMGMAPDGGDTAVMLAALTGGSRLAPGDPLPTAYTSGWSWQSGWRAFAIAALALFVVDILLRYAPGLLLRSRRDRPFPGTGLPA